MWPQSEVHLVNLVCGSVMCVYLGDWEPSEEDAEGSIGGDDKNDKIFF